MTQPEFFGKSRGDQRRRRHNHQRRLQGRRVRIQFSPGHQEVGGKDQIAELWVHFGMRVIRDMVPTAKRAEELEAQIRHLRIELDKARDEMEALKKGEAWT